MEKFRIRPGYQSELLLVEFWGEHRSPKFPDIARILARGLKAKPAKHPFLDVASIALATDEFISIWEYDKGSYELCDDIWAYFIHAPKNNSQVMADIERILLKSGEFIKEEVDFDEFA